MPTKYDVSIVDSEPAVVLQPSARQQVEPDAVELVVIKNVALGLNEYAPFPELQLVAL